MFTGTYQLLKMKLSLTQVLVGEAAGGSRLKRSGDRESLVRLGNQLPLQRETQHSLRGYSLAQRQQQTSPKLLGHQCRHKPLPLATALQQRLQLYGHTTSLC